MSFLDIVGIIRKHKQKNLVMPKNEIEWIVKCVNDFKGVV